MQIEKLTLTEALQQAPSLPLAWIHALSQIYIGKNSEQPDLNTLLEARFFDRDREIRIFPGAEGLAAVSLTLEPTDHVLEEVHPIRNQAFGHSLTILKVLEFDEDGQAGVVAVKLADWKEEA